VKESGFGLARGPLLNAFLFQVFNTSSFYLIMGLPMMLYFKKMGASATVLGVVAALGALMNIFQIPAARFVERIGYRKFVLRGWMSRSLMIAGVALVVSLPLRIDDATRQILVLFLLFLFNIARGISLSGYLPWISAIVPESVRGRFLSMDQAASQTALLLTVALSAVYLQAVDSPSAFGALFAVSLVLAGLSLLYLKKIPDAPISPAAREGGEEVPWKAMIQHGPFLKLVIFHAIMMLALSGGGLIFIPFARDQLGISDSKFMILHLIWGAVFVLTSLATGKMLDRVGSRPVLGLAAFIFGIHWLGWGAVAAHLVPFQWGPILFQQATAGIGLALYNSAHMRLLMATVPAMGRSHFFALFSVAASLVAGLAPLGWGLLTDALLTLKYGTVFEVNRFVILYVTITLILIPAMVALRRIHEERASTTEELLKELVLESPWRSITRWWNRRPFA
jgi:MFS family permease